jgi:hypothetical protein
MMDRTETLRRIERAYLKEPGQAIGDIVAESSAGTAVLGRALHPCVERSEAARITSHPERTARWTLNDVIVCSIPIRRKEASRRVFPVDAQEIILFPRLSPKTDD